MLEKVPLTTCQRSYLFLCISKVTKIKMILNPELIVTLTPVI